MDLAKFTFVLFIVFTLFHSIDIHVLCNFICRRGLGNEEQLPVRKWFRHNRELRFMFHYANLLAASATCNKEICRTVMKELGLLKRMLPFLGQLVMLQVLSRCQICTFIYVVKTQR